MMITEWLEHKNEPVRIVVKGLFPSSNHPDRGMTKKSLSCSP